MNPASVSSDNKERLESKIESSSSSSSSSSAELQGRQVVSQPALPELPKELYQLIADHASDERDPFSAYPRRVFSPTVLTKMQTLGSFDKELLLLRADEALRDALFAVDGDPGKLDEQSKVRLKEIAPHIRHLNLSLMKMSAEKIENIVRALAFTTKGQEKPTTAIEALTLSQGRTCNDTLKALAKLKTEGVLTHLKKLDLDDREWSHSCSDNTEGANVLQLACLLQDLESIAVNTNLDESSIYFPVNTLTECRKLKSFTAYDNISIKQLQDLSEQGILKQLDFLSFLNNQDTLGPFLSMTYGGCGIGELFTRLGQADMHLKHFILPGVEILMREIYDSLLRMVACKSSLRIPKRLLFK